MYNEEETRILSYFFTNLDKPVFAAKNFHPEVWALMQARYSRSKDGLRESFLQLLKEDPANYDSLKNALASNNQASMDNAVSKAIQFMEKWVLGYGHSSVAEGAVVGIGLEGISSLASDVVENNRLASYIEKSTRYVSFGNDSFFIPKEIIGTKHEARVKACFEDLFKTYMDLHAPVLEYIQKESPLKEGMNDSAWKRASAARRFDAIRYLLPAATKTSLGWTLNARQLAHAINKLLSHPLEEMRELGLLLQQEGKKALPSLLKYTGEKNYFIETEKQLRSKQLTKNGEKVKLVDYPEKIEEKIISAIIFKYSNQDYQTCFNQASKMTSSEREELLDSFLGRQEEFDYPMRELEYSDFTFEGLMDYGGFRDVQRHRMATISQQLLTCFHGFDTPPDIIAAGVEKQYAQAMNHAKEVFQEVYEDNPYAAQYLVPRGFKHRFLFKANLRTLYHFIKLRSQPQGHYSYVEFAKKMHSIMIDQFPLAMKYCVCAKDLEELGRLKAEQRLEDKIKKGTI
ncbi:FAD-dependent thymidylate synthase [Candidatus Micrarchaeota archaeon]|nr:FAD-dependent thymidylate synthase [Candidatus Micrarchaeota archaeon]